MQTLETPNVIPMPFANKGDKNEIPTSATGSQLASYQEGFPVITQTAIEEGGIPPERNDFNGILYLLSQWQYAFQNGWLPTFSDSVSAAIGGYAQNAILWYYPTTGTDANRAVPLRSLIQNNIYNFNTNPDYIGVYWGRVDGFITPEQLAAAVATLNQSIDTKASQTDFNALSAKVPSGDAVGYPDLTAPISISSGYTTTQNGWIYMIGDGSSQSSAYNPAWLAFDGVVVWWFSTAARDGRDGMGRSTVMLPVKAGTAVTATRAASATSLIFYPNL